mgnify:CR=1
LSGPTRPNTIFTIGIKNEKLNRNFFQSIIRNGKKVNYARIKEIYFQ